MRVFGCQARTRNESEARGRALARAGCRLLARTATCGPRTDLFSAQPRAAPTSSPGDAQGSPAVSRGPPPGFLPLP